MNPTEIGRLTIRDRIDRYSEWDPNTGCQLWFGSQDRSGYPRITYLDKRLPVHRLSLLDHMGIADTSLHVMHKCHTPACVNPEHLRFGTHEENMNDVQARNHPRPYSRVYPEDRNEIIRRFSSGEPIRSISRGTGFDVATIRRHTKNVGRPAQ